VRANVALRVTGEEYEIAIESSRPGATLGDLLATVVDVSTGEIYVDGRSIPATAPLVEAGLVPGSLIELGEHPGPDSSKPSRTGGLFNRPPRIRSAAGIDPIVVPRPPDPVAAPVRFSWPVLVVPLALGLIMAVLINPRMAMFALFSPLMMLTNWLEDRRRNRRGRIDGGRAYTAELEVFATELGEAADRAARQIRTANPGPTETMRRAREVDTRLWERRPHHDDFMRIGAGIGCSRWDSPLVGEPAATAPGAAIVARYGRLHQIPITIDLRPGNVCGIAGSRPAALAACRALLIQVATHHGPADVRVSIVTEHPREWDWAKWLPHVLIDGSRRRLATNPTETAAIVAALVESTEADRAPGPLHLVITDVPDLASGARADLRDAMRDGAGRGVAGLAIAGRAVDLPSLCTTIYVPDEGRIRRDDGCAVELSPWVIGTRDARETGRALARLVDPEVRSPGTGVPERLRLSELLEFGDPAGIVESWRGNVVELAAPIGRAAAGLFEVDLVADGPHALLAGTTGAGKSELLRTLVASLAVTVDPEHLNFVLIDYKGGSAFDACSGLPHTVGLVTDLDPHLAMRALQCLEAELRHREQRLRAVGAADIGAFATSASRRRIRCPAW